MARGDESAVQECLDRFGGLVWSLARKMIRNASDAEDAVQEVFIEVWKNAGRYDAEVASETTFVAMIARRRLIDRLRRVGREPIRETLIEGSGTSRDDAPPVEEVVEQHEEAARAAAMIGELRPEQQQVLRLTIYEGWSHQQISEQLDMPLGTVKTHARRGLMALRERLGVASPAPEAPERKDRDEETR